MKRILSILPLILLLFCACEDDPKTPMSAVSASGSAKFDSDTSGKEMITNMKSIYTAQQMQLVKVPFDTIPRDTALKWIDNYDKVVPAIGHDSLVKRIQFDDNHLGVLFLKSQRIKLFVALPSSNVSGTNRVLTVLLQVKLRSSGLYQYYDLSKKSELTISDVDKVFCPPPYPCATSPIEE